MKREKDLNWYVRYLKFHAKNKQQHAKDFDVATLPAIDRDETNIDDLIASLNITEKLPFDLKEKLNFWRENGYVILENVFEPALLDKFWGEIENTIENRTRHSLTALVHQFNDQKETPIKDVPKERLHAVGSRLNNYHESSLLGKQVMANKYLSMFLKAVLGEKLTAFQSLVFKYGSQQGAHQDFPWVTTKIPSHLAAAWIPLEDVQAGSGTLFYFPGSHKMPKFNFGTGILYEYERSLFTPEEFEEYLKKTTKEIGYERKELLIKKGDLLVWHGALAHGGNKIVEPVKTRKSFVCHYSTDVGYPKHRFEKKSDSEVANVINDITFYTNPENAAEENCIV